MYFLLAGAIERFHLIGYGLACVLIFVGLKMVWLNAAFDGHFPIVWSLAIITAAHRRQRRGVAGLSAAEPRLSPRSSARRADPTRPTRPACPPCGRGAGQRVSSDVGPTHHARRPRLPRASRLSRTRRHPSGAHRVDCGRCAGRRARHGAATAVAFGVRAGSIAWPHALDGPMRLGVAALIGIGVTAVQRRGRARRRQAQAMHHAQILLCVSGAMMMVLINDSLARAFGIAGAASLVRFRTPVDDPRDAAVMFLLIGLGMASGVGAFALAAGGAVDGGGCSWCASVAPAARAAASLRGRSGGLRSCFPRRARAAGVRAARRHARDSRSLVRRRSARHVSGDVRHRRAARRRPRRSRWPTARPVFGRCHGSRRGRGCCERRSRTARHRPEPRRRTIVPRHPRGPRTAGPVDLPLRRPRRAGRAGGGGRAAACTSAC